MLPDVPTTAEAGLPDVRMDTWFGWSARPACRRRSSRASTHELRGDRKQPAFQDKLAKLGLPWTTSRAAEFVSFIADETRKWHELIPAMGIPQVD